MNTDETQLIPEAALEAAAEAVYGHQFDEGVREATTARLRTALEAAAPHMLAEAWEAGMVAAKLQAAGIKTARNPYRPTP